MKIKLSEEQNNAVDFLYNFAHNDKNYVAVLSGKGGVGKTTVTKFLCNKLEKDGFLIKLIAPTNKAKLVLEKSTGRLCDTIHSFLGLSPVLDIAELDMNDLKFKQIKYFANIFGDTIIICDEGSMVTDDLYNYLSDICTKHKVKIIFILDEAQLAPVKKGDLSETVKCKNRVSLTKIFRQNDTGVVYPLLEKLRVNDICDIKSDKSSVDEIFTYNTPRDLLLAYKDVSFKDLHNQKFNFGKIIAYTNNRVNQYNEIIHRTFSKEKEYMPGELLSFRSSIDRLDIYNSEDYYIVDAYEDLISIPNVGKYNGWKLKIINEEGITKEIKTLSKNISVNDLNIIGQQIETFRQEAINRNNSKGRSKNWMIYYEAYNSFLSTIDLMVDKRCIKSRSLSYGYAITSHMSQSSTYDVVFADFSDMNKCKNEMERRQLKYVALSRTRKDVHILI